MIDPARSLRITVGALLAASAVACAPSPVNKRIEAAQAVDQERTPEKLEERGRLFYEMRDLMRAEQYLAAALNEGADPKRVLPLFMKVAVAQQHFRVALEYGERFLSRDPNNVELRFVVATLYLSVGDNKSGRRHLERIIADAPDSPDAHYVMAVLARDTEGDPVGADKHFREYLRIVPEGPHAEEARASLLKTVQ